MVRTCSSPVKTLVVLGSGLRTRPPPALSPLCEAAALRYLLAQPCGSEDLLRVWLGRLLPAPVRQALVERALADTGLPEPRLLRLLELLSAPGLTALLLPEPFSSAYLRQRCYRLVQRCASSLRRLRLPLPCWERGEPETLGSVLCSLSALTELVLPSAGSDALLEAAGAGCPRLQRLDASGSGGAVTSRGVLRLLVPAVHRRRLMRRCLSAEHALPSELRQCAAAPCAATLREVRLRDCQVTSCGLSLLLGLCPGLERLDHENTAGAVRALTALDPALQFALCDVSCAGDVTGTEVTSLLTHCPALTSMSVGRLRDPVSLAGLSSSGVLELTLWKTTLGSVGFPRLLPELSRLSRLALSCADPCLVEVVALLQACPRLQQLELTECRLVYRRYTGGGDTTGSDETPTQLRRLCLSGWMTGQLDRAVVLALVARSPQLRHLHLSPVSGLVDSDLDRLVPERCETLTLTVAQVTSDRLWAVIGRRWCLREMTLAALVTHDWRQYNELDEVRERAASQNLALKITVLGRRRAALAAMGQGGENNAGPRGPPVTV